MSATSLYLMLMTFIYLFLTFYIRILLVNNVIVAGAQQSDAAIHIPVSVLPQIPFPSRLPHNTEQSPLCYTVGPCWVPILNTAVCTCPSQTV